jgi:anti-sigma factor RsiW
MSSMGSAREADALRLHAYHDGELGRFARWRFERHLDRSPGLRRELAELAFLGDLARDSEARAPEPDLWDPIALRLPAEDARRAEQEIPQKSRLWWIGPAGALTAAGLVAIALVFGSGSSDTSEGGVVRWMDGGQRSVLILEEESTTIIWILDEPGADAAAAGGLSEVV